MLLLRGLLVLLLGTALAKGGGALYDEPRPFVVHHTRPLIPHAPDNGFPSDHTLLTAGCAFLIIPFSWPAGVAVMAVALVVGLSRIACGLHSPLDIGASIVFALLAAGAASLLVRRESSNLHPQEPASQLSSSI